MGDNRLYVTILEHWWAVLHDRATFTNPNFFWPESHVLGYSDAVFLYAIPYVLLRYLGFDYYLSFELTLIALKILGFLAMLWLLRSFVRLSQPVALVGASLFTLSNLYYISVGHPQLLSVVFVPLLCCLTLSYQRRYESGRKAAAIAYLLSASALLGLSFFTSYYIAWFTVLVASGVLAAGTAGAIIIRRSLAPLTEFASALRKHAANIVLALLVFGATMVPFFMTYIPVLEATGGRSYAETFPYCAEPVDVINIGLSNWMWGDTLKPLLMPLGSRFGAAEKERGWTPFLLLTCVGAATLASIGVLKTPPGRVHCRDSYAKLAALLGISTGILWALSINVGGHSLWWLVFSVFPGASAIRVPVRISHVLNIPVIVVVAITLEKTAARSRRRGLRQVIIALCGMTLAAEQINVGHYHGLDRARETKNLGVVKAPPPACKAFVATRPENANRPPYADQVDAMLVARTYNIPTLNGYSGWLPANWGLFNFDKDYLEHAKHWARAKGVTEGLCGCDFRTGVWSGIKETQEEYILGSTIDFHEGGDGEQLEAQGWGASEPGGTWTVGRRSVLLLHLPSGSKSELRLEFEAHAFTPPSRPEFAESLFVNDTAVAEWEITDRSPVIRKTVTIPRTLGSGSLMRLEFVNHDPLSPRQLGLSSDARQVGLALHTLKLEAETPAGRPGYVLGQQIDFHRGGNAAAFEDGGWCVPEPEGTWTLGAHSILELNLGSAPKTDLMLQIEAHAFAPAERPEFIDTLWVNDKKIADWRITGSEGVIKRRVRLPRSICPSRVVRVELVNHDPRSPADLGLSIDGRKIGLALHYLRLQAVRSASPGAPPDRQ